MRGVQERGQKTRQKIINTAFSLFHQKGTNATSIDEILEKSGTGKSQFYYYFKNKDDLVHSVLQNFYEMDRSKKYPFKYEVNSFEDLEEWFSGFINFQKSVDCAQGCPLATIGYGLTDEHELLRQDIHLIFEYRKNILAKFFQALKAKGKLKESIDPDSLADFCYTIMQGGMVASKIRKNTTPFENAVFHVMTYLKLLQV